MGLLYKGFKWATANQNVYLWLAYQEGLNYHAVNHINQAKQEGKSLEWAAEKLLAFLESCSPHTPDGVRYTKSNLLFALESLSNLPKGYLS